MISFLKKTFKTDFFGNLATMLTGTIISQIITLAAMPILSRIYSPADFGSFALVFTTISVFGLISTGNYHNAIILPDEDNAALKLLKLSIFCTTFFSVFLVFIIFILPKHLIHLVIQGNIYSYIYIVPLGVLILGLSQTFSYWHNRKKNFRVIASNKIIQNSSVAVVNLSSGLIKPSTWGLISGYIVGQGITLWVLIKKSKLGYTPFKMKGLKEVAIKYKNFPLFLSPMVLLNTFSLNILIYLLSVYYDQTTVGLYSQAYKAINYPLFFVSASFSTVFFQKINESKNRISIYTKSFVFSILLSFIILLPIMIWGSQLFVIFFGSKWALAGQMAAILCPLTIIGFAVSNVAEVFSVMQKNHILLVWQIFYLLIAYGIIIYFKKFGILTMLFWFSCCCSILYLIIGIIGLLLLKKNEENR